MHLGALIIALTLSGPPPEPTGRPPERWANGSGLLAVGGTLKVLSLAGGITGAVIGGPGLIFELWSVAPSAIGGAMLVGGSWMRGRHAGWYGENDLSHRVRPARTAGWALVGTGGALLLGSSVAIGLWPFDPVYDDGGVARHPGAFAAVQAAFLLAPLLIGAGSSAVAWTKAYPRWRSYRVEIHPSIGGLGLRF